VLLTYDDCQNFLEQVIRSLVEFPEDLVVVQEEQGGKAVLSVSVKKSDVGRIIGKNGQVIKALRAVLFAAKSDDLLCDIFIKEDAL